jgi:hypothetical protein
MRRRWIKHLQRASANWMPASRRERARNSMIKQNRWARRAGLPLLTFSITLLLASMIVTGSYFLILGLNDAGYLEPSDSMQH